MSDKKHEFASALGGFVGLRQPTATQVVKVLMVDLNEMTVDVEDSDGLTLYNVRLRASIDGSDDGVLMVPAVGSYVVVGLVGTDEYAVISTTAIDKVSIKINGAELTVTQTGFAFQKGTTKFELDNSGLLIERAGQNLKTALDTLITQIQAITVTCAAPGAPSTPPLNVVAFNAVKTQIDQILK
jgi:hypothetical protein